jgi:putative addiction module component (TIGR02574 family)
MTAAMADLLEEALKLPPDARAALVASLLESLDAEADPQAQAAWQAEIEHRMKELDAGTASTVSWEEVKSRIGGGSGGAAP